MADMTLEEALAAATVDEELISPVNEVLMINPETRTINVPDSEKLFGARQDMNAERKYFKCPRIVGDNIDLSEHRIFVNYVPSKQDGSYDQKEDVQSYWCEDLAVEGDYITFSWKLSENAMRSAGYIAFAVYAKTIDENGNLQTKWHTTIAIGNVLDTLPDGESIAEEYPDIIMQLLERMDALEQGGGSGGTPNAVQYVAQTLTQEQQTQARSNIGAASTNEVSKLSEDIAALKQNGTDGNSGSIFTASTIPKVFLTGDTFDDMTADKNEVLMKLRYISDLEDFESYIKIKWQGSTSIQYPKKNFTIKMYEDEACETKMKKDLGWGEQNKYCLKANWIDHSHARNITSARLWGQMVANRSDYALLPQELRESPNNGAINGFPIKMYINGVYHGLYTWNIPKDAWTFNMDEDNADHCVLCGVLNNGGNNSMELSTEFRAHFNTGAWEVEVGTMSDKLTTSFNAMIDCVKDTTDEDFKAQIGNYLDVQSAIDYYLFAYVSCALDNLGRNMIMLTYDGTLWRCSAYDLDCTWGNTPWGTSLVSSDFLCPEQYQETNNLLFQRLVSCFTDEMKARYAELRQTVFSKSNMIITLEGFTDEISKELYADDLDQYPTVPMSSANNPKQIRKFMNERIDYVDTMIPNLGEESGGDTGGGEDSGEDAVAVTALSLSKDSLTFANASTSQPNPEHFSDAQLLTFTQGYNLGATGSVSAYNPNGVNDYTTLDVIPVDIRSTVILNPNANTIKAYTYYDESEAPLEHIYSQTITDKIIPTPYKYWNNLDSAQYMRLQASGEPSYMYVAKVKNWTKLEDSLVPSGSGDVYTGAIIPATKGNVVIMRTVGDSAEYFTAFVSYADSSGSGANFTTRYADTKAKLKCAEITDDTCAYIGFKVNRALYNEGGYIEYCIIDSIDDAIVTEQGEYSTENVIATITPNDASNKNVSWSVDNDIVELNTSGLACIVTAKSSGTATLTCTAEDKANGLISDSCSITVR